MPKKAKAESQQNKYGVPRIFEETPTGKTMYYIGMEELKEDGNINLKVMSGFLHTIKEAEGFIRFLEDRKKRLGYYVNKDIG